MKLIKPFSGLRPQVKYLNEVIAPPYDIVNREQAIKIASGKPYNFLHISKPEIDLPVDVDPYSDIVYQTGAKNFQKLLKQKILQQDPTNCYYLYRLTESNRHQQTGLVAAISIEAYVNGEIKKHETTRLNKEADRVKNIEALNAQASPVMLTYQHDKEIDQLLSSLCETKPIYNAMGYKQVTHEFWVIDDPKWIQNISHQFNKISKLYIADGHHRIAAAATIAAKRNLKNDDLANSFLGVLFPDNQLQILSYNRVFRDLNGLTPAQFLQALEPVFDIQKRKNAIVPEHKAKFGLYINHCWYSLTVKPIVQNEIDPENKLEVGLLRDYIAKPI